MSMNSATTLIIIIQINIKIVIVDICLNIDDVVKFNQIPSFKMNI